MNRPPKNIAASNRAKLLNLSRETGQSFQELVQYFAMGRFLYRLAVSDVSSQFTLKGAMLLHARHVTQARSTLDIDLLGRMDNGQEAVHQAIDQILRQPVDDDGLIFLPDSIVVSEITKEGLYIGRRVNFRAKLGAMQIPMQVDIGFGDVVIPPSTLVDTPHMLGYPPAKIHAYTFETSVAEKAHAMMKLGVANSRMKDFYDIWILSRQGKLDKTLLVEAMVGTFGNQGTKIDLDSPIFSKEFALLRNKQTQWAAFRRKRAIQEAPQDFATIARETLAFLKPCFRRVKDAME